ncbi:hypothetical protein [Bacillus sinesaloumensis]|uniref:hypothetical protein n=1 Tax=Litchfieldia sinesaloumensis TaxID=1926280 RepID=UPI0013562A9B|nr:hypothetical protein [Bacillus sinesaloumensis]
MKFVKDEEENYLEEESHIEVQGMLFTEVDVGDGRKVEDLRLGQIWNNEKVRIVGYSF